MSNGKCNDCNVRLDEVVECSKCGYYCINCYESKHERWTLIHSENHCKDICHNCICEFCLNEYEGHDEDYIEGVKKGILMGYCLGCSLAYPLKDMNKQGLCEECQGGEEE